MIDECHGIEAYPVGFLHDLKGLKNRLWAIDRGIFHMTRRDAWRFFLRSIGRSWRRRSYWNGYLAEWHYCPEGVRHTKAGRGWTKRAALRRLGAHIVASNPYRPEYDARAVLTQHARSARAAQEVSRG